MTRDSLVVYSIAIGLGAEKGPNTLRTLVGKTLGPRRVDLGLIGSK